MRLFVVSLFSLLGALYAFAAFISYREEVRARDGFPSASVTAAPLDGLSATDRGSTPPSLHPEANLARLRAAFASKNYTDELEPVLESALDQAPTFYQPSFLLAAFYANRLEHPDVIARCFEAALDRFPSNGRLHLTYAEWLLTPRTRAAYRSHRVDSESIRNASQRGTNQIEQATALEPDLVRRALNLMLRFRLPLGSWTSVLPDDGVSRVLILQAAERAPRDVVARRELLASYLSRNQETAVLETLVRLGRAWDQPEVALVASERWRAAALAENTGAQLTRSTLSLVREYLDNNQSDRAFEVLRNTVSTFVERNLSQDNAELLVGAGDLYLARTRTAMAQSLFTEAATLFPFDAKAYLGLARTHARDGNTENAIVELRRVLELEPNNNQARSMLNAFMERH
jgi:tetratricopeptide (TPR) repeat protein